VGDGFHPQFCPSIVHQGTFAYPELTLTILEANAATAPDPLLPLPTVTVWRRIVRWLARSAVS
jgi:hypothetical protein